MMKKILLVLAFFLWSGFQAPVLGQVTLDQTIQSTTGQSIPQGIIKYDKSPSGDQYTQGKDALSFVGLLQKATDFVAITISAVAIVFIVINGLKITYSGGGEELNNAKTGLLWASLGLLMVIFSYIVVKTLIALTYLA